MKNKVNEQNEVLLVTNLSNTSPVLHYKQVFIKPKVTKLSAVFTEYRPKLWTFLNFQIKYYESLKKAI